MQKSSNHEEAGELNILILSNNEQWKEKTGYKQGEDFITHKTDEGCIKDEKRKSVWKDQTTQWTGEEGLRCFMEEEPGTDEVWEDAQPR